MLLKCDGWPKQKQKNTNIKKVIYIAVHNCIDIKKCPHMHFLNVQYIKYMKLWMKAEN